jgi:hypothetical protein
MNIKPPDVDRKNRRVKPKSSKNSSNEIRILNEDNESCQK